MKILLLYPMQDHQTGPAIKYAFERLDHEVRAVDVKNVDAGKPYAACYEFKPDLVFCSRTSQLADDVAAIRKRLKNAIICMWNVDTRTMVESWEHLFPLIELCDYQFVVNDYHVAEWNRRFKTKTFWLPQGLQNEVYDKPKEITDKDREMYSCDVSFIGTCRSRSHKGVSAYKWRKDILNTIRETGANLKTWSCEGSPRIWNEAHNKAVSLSKINLGISRLYGNKVRKCISVRDYKIMGAGGFLLELHREGINEIFPSNTMECYTTLQDLAVKVQDLLRPEYECERQQIAERGYRWVHENVTYTHRMKKALKIMRL